MALGTYETVLVEKENGITWVKFNRPEKRNAMSPQLCYDMVDVLTELETDDETQILVLTGEGEAFTAGMDLRLFFRDLDDNGSLLVEQTDGTLRTITAGEVFLPQL